MNTEVVLLTSTDKLELPAILYSPTVSIVLGVDHGFHGKETEMAQRIAQWLTKG